MKVTTGIDRKTKAKSISISGTPEEKKEFRNRLISQPFAVREKDQSHFLIANNLASAAFLANYV